MEQQGEACYYGPPMKGGVFLSYRRGDTAGYAGRLYDRLKSRFPGRVFMDVGEITPGTDFVTAINARLSECKVLIALIGREWKTSRSDSSIDFVHLEIATALARGVRVVPVLLRGATMPAAAELPADLASFSTRQALEINDQNWDFGCEQLIAVINKELGLSPWPTGKWLGLSVAFIVAATLVGLGWWWHGLNKRHMPVENQPPPRADSSLISSVQRYEQSTANAYNAAADVMDEVARKIGEAGQPQAPSGQFPTGVWHMQSRDNNADSAWIKINTDATFGVRSKKPQFAPAGSWSWDPIDKSLTLKFNSGVPPWVLSVSEQTNQSFVATDNGRVYSLVRE